MPIAITRGPSRRLPECELSFLERQPIDVERARLQHRAYQDAIRAAGLHVVDLPALNDLPDSSFVEDTAIVLDELAVIAPMGAESRRPESAAMAGALASYRPVTRLSAPATLDGGDVLRVGKTLYVGQTPRTNAASVDQLCARLAPLGYQVVPVPVTKCLHLKSACARLDDDTVLINPDWIDPATFGDARIVTVADEEPWGANALSLGDRVIFPASEPKTRALVEQLGFATTAVDVSEFQKAEAGVTCLSLILR